MRVAYFTLWFPKLSQTFIQREIAGLRQQGIEVDVYPCHGFRHPPPPVDAPYRVHYGRWLERLAWPLAAVRELGARPALAREGMRWLWRHPPRTIEAAYMTGIGLATALRTARAIRAGGYDLLHGAWANGTATAVAVLSVLTGVPFSFGAHARDLYRGGGDPFLVPKVRAARFVHTTTQASVEYLRTRSGGAGNVVLARRGLATLPPAPAHEAHGGPLRLLSVGRLVEKKGHGDVIDACRILVGRGVAFELRVVGSGPLRRRLERQVARADLGGRVRLCGARPHAAVEEQYAWADVLIHAGIVDRHGDRDGLPNVVPEAQAREVAVVARAGPGVDEAVIDGETGLLVSGAGPAGLADAIARLAADPELRRRLGQGGRQWVAGHFLLEHNAPVLAAAMRAAETRAGG